MSEKGNWLPVPVLPRAGYSTGLIGLYIAVNAMLLSTNDSYLYVTDVR
jgi:hypothetical protein